MSELERFHTVREFVSKELDAEFKSLSPKTNLISDLGVAGDDGVEFMEKFSLEFGVDCTEFDISGVFGTEGFSLLSLIYLFLRPLFFFLNKSVSEQENEVTVQHLMDAVVTKKIKTIEQKDGHYVVTAQ